jgi:hypothetical protein
MSDNFEKQDEGNKLNIASQEEEEELKLEEFIFSNFNPESQKILEELEEDDQSFNEKIESILAKLNDGDDLILVQTELLILIKEKLELIRKKKNGDNKELEIDDTKSKRILRHITELSKYIINQRSQAARSQTNDLKKSDDKYYGVSQESLKNLKNVIRRFIVYEIYMFINPHRIAGETRKQTFIHNVILRGMEEARHHEGGTDGEIRSYGQKMIRDLANKHTSFKRGNNIIR